VTLGGRWLQVERPRVRSADGSGELAVPSYELFSSTEVLARMAMEWMLAGLSTRRYPAGLEPVGARGPRATGTSKSEVSRRFVAMTETALADLLRADLAGLDLLALIIDGVHFAESCRVVALGIGVHGTKHPLALVDGPTENATLVTDLLIDLRERNRYVTRMLLVVLDGAKALCKAVVDVFDHPVIARCQLHKIRNVEDKLPKELAATVARKMRAADHADWALAAEAKLTTMAAELERTHPRAAASLREGLDATPTVLRLRVPPTLARTLRSTNAIESMISICREHSSNVRSGCRTTPSHARRQQLGVRSVTHGAVAGLWRQTDEALAATGTADDGGYEMPLPTNGRYVITAIGPRSFTSISAALSVWGASRAVDLQLPILNGTRSPFATWPPAEPDEVMKRPAVQTARPLT
jgi:putative transposase